jgi:MerR family transcriptional regulator, aldehyde-responsive regulator
MNISEASKLTGLSVDTIRFYEKSGMLPPAERDNRGWRSYGGESLQWLTNLGRLRATGMPLADIRRFARLVHGSVRNDETSAQERLELLQQHSERLQQRQLQLDDCKSFLAHKISVYQSQVKRS